MVAVRWRGSGFAVLRGRSTGDGEVAAGHQRDSRGASVSSISLFLSHTVAEVVGYSLAMAAARGDMMGRRGGCERWEGPRHGSAPERVHTGEVKWLWRSGFILVYG